MAFQISVPGPSGPTDLRVDPGSTLHFIGANGGGKTRLAVLIEDTFGDRAHRISAHRALTLDADIPKVSERIARKAILTGHANQDAAVHHRPSNRWRQKPATALLNDFQYLQQALFAEQANTALLTHQSVWAGDEVNPRKTKFQELISIWERVLPHRRLTTTGDHILVSVPGTSDTYNGEQMSDGERAAFYLIAQTLLAPENCIIIFDEPELHIHRSILATLWDEIEAARTDCAMVLISHDLDFVATREGQKYVLVDYTPSAGWRIEAVPDATGFSEEVTTLILGSRRPILFVEGTEESLDQAIYRACFPEWTIIPRGSCAEVVHSVATLRANSSLTRVSCAGLVDADGQSAEDVAYLSDKGVSVLPVSEIENLFLLPDVVRAIAAGEGHSGTALDEKVGAIHSELFEQATANLDGVILRFSRRRIDRALKKIDLSDSLTVAELEASYARGTSALSVRGVAASAASKIAGALAANDAVELLKWYDHKKGVIAIACKAKDTSPSKFEQWIVRSLRNGTAPALVAAIQSAIPTPSAG